MTAISGDPDLFVSTNATFPGINNAMWSARRTGSDSMKIAGSQLALGPVYIAVYGTTFSNFNIMVQSVPSVTSDLVQLEDDIPVQMSMEKGSYGYFKFHVKERNLHLVCFFVVFYSYYLDNFSNSVTR